MGHGPWYYLGNAIYLSYSESRRELIVAKDRQVRIDIVSTSAKVGRLCFLYLGERGRLIQLSPQEALVSLQLSARTPVAKCVGKRSL